jgi:ribosomal protein L9
MKRILTFIVSAVFFIFVVVVNILDFELFGEDISNYLDKGLLIFAGLFLSFGSALLFNYRLGKQIKSYRSRLDMWTKLAYHVNQAGDEIFNELPIGIIAIDAQKEVKWANPYSKIIFGDKIIDTKLSVLNQTLVDAVDQKKDNVFVVSIKNESYDVYYKKQFGFFYFFLVTDRETIKKKYNEQIPVVGYINFDNSRNELASLDVHSQSVLKSEYLSIVSDYITSNEGFLKTINEEQLLFFCYKKDLLKMIDDKFSVLDQVKAISNTHRVRVSLSIGIASWELNYDKVGYLAQNALDLAEKRGGDQVVVNIQNNKIQFFGAKSSTTGSQSRTEIKLAAEKINEAIKKSDKVFIMGHTHSDLDSLGAMICTYYLAKLDCPNVKIVCEKDSLEEFSYKAFTTLVENQNSIVNEFISHETAVLMINDKSLLIVVDTQSPKLVEQQVVLNRAKRTIVIDHHRVGEDSFNAEYSLVKTSFSSTCEILMELFYYYPNYDKINFTKFEASIMYSGIFVDTTEFSSRTSSRTFEVISKLIDFGADPMEVKMWLRRNYYEIQHINKLLEKVDIFNKNVAFITSNEIYDDKSFIAILADEALKIAGIEASFAIMRLNEETTAISARSYKNINVQTLLEPLGGGGHINMAAAQIKGTTIKAVVQTLKDKIQVEYGGDEVVKVILITDVKDLGKENQIIEVKAGYANFLFSKRLAIMASEENVKNLEAMLDNKRQSLEKHEELMRRLKLDIDNKRIEIQVTTGAEGKFFGSVTTKQIVDKFNENYGIVLDKRKVEIVGEINSFGIYTVNVKLYENITASFEVVVSGKADGQK